MNSSYNITVSEKGDVTILPIDGKYDYCLVFIHGLDQPPLQSVQFFLSDPLKSALKNFKIVLPVAPIRKMTHHQITTISWFDIKTYEQSFERPFEEAFSSEDIKDSFNLLQSVVDREANLLNNNYKQIFIGGFSQGCGMSIFTSYHLKHEVAGVVGIAGYFFEITKVDPSKKFPILIIHGNSDKLRPWNQVAITYDKFQGSDKVVLVEGMGHEMKTLKTRELLAQFLVQESVHQKL